MSEKSGDFGINVPQDIIENTVEHTLESQELINEEAVNDPQVEETPLASTEDKIEEPEIDESIEGEFRDAFKEAYDLRKENEREIEAPTEHMEGKMEDMGYVAQKTEYDVVNRVTGETIIKSEVEHSLDETQEELPETIKDETSVEKSAKEQTSTDEKIEDETKLTKATVTPIRPDVIIPEAENTKLEKEAPETKITNEMSQGVEVNDSPPEEITLETKEEDPGEKYVDSNVEKADVPEINVTEMREEIKEDIKKMPTDSANEVYEKHSAVQKMDNESLEKKYQEKVDQYRNQVAKEDEVFATEKTIAEEVLKESGKEPDSIVKGNEDPQTKEQNKIIAEEPEQKLEEPNEKIESELTLETEPKPEVAPTETTESQPTKEEQENIIAKRFEEYGISKEELASVKGFNDLKTEQKLLVAENLKQLSLGHLEKVTAAKFSEMNAGIEKYKQVWNTFRKGHRMKVLGKEVYAGNMNAGLAFHGEDLNKLVEGAKYGPGVELMDDGTLEIQYATGFENLTVEQQKSVDAFNKTANEFARVPLEWKYAKEGSKERKEYDAKKEEFENAKDFVQELKESEENREEAIKFEARMAEGVEMNQFYNANPDIEERLASIRDGETWAAAAKRQFKEKGAFMAVGFVTRHTLTGLMGTAAFPAAFATAGFVGGLRGRKIGKADIEDRNFLERHGKEKEGVEGRNVNDISTSTTRIKELVEQIETTVEPEKLKKLRAKLQRRVDFNALKDEQGKLSVGESSESVGNVSRYINAMGEGRALLLAGDPPEINEKAKSRLDSKLELLDKQIAEEDKAHIRKKVWDGAMTGLKFGAVGALIADYMSDGPVTEAGKNIVEDIKEGLASGSSNYEDIAETMNVVGATVAATATEAPKPEASRFQEVLENAKATATTETIDTPTNFAYEVQPGDNLWKILEKQLSTRMYTEGMDEVHKTHLIDTVKDRIADMSNEELSKIGFTDIGPDGRVNINFLNAKDQLDFSSVLGDTEFMTESLKDTATLSQEVATSIADDMAGIEETSDAAGESVATAAEIPTEAVPPEQVTENAVVEDTLEENGIIIEPENEVMSQEQAEDALPFDKRVPKEFNSADIENYYNTKYGPEVAEKMKGSLETLFGSSPELFTEWKGNAMWPGMKDQPASDLFYEQQRYDYLNSTRVDGSPSVLTYTNESGEKVTDMAVQAKRTQLFNMLDEIKEKGITPTEDETVESFMARGYGEIAEINTHGEAIADVTVPIDPSEVNKTPPQAQTPNYTGEEIPETLTVQNATENAEGPTKRPSFKIANYEHLEDLEAMPATPEQLADANYLRTKELSSKDYENLSKMYGKEYREIEQDLKKIFDAENYEKQRLSELRSAERSRQNEVLKYQREKISDIRSSNRGDSGLKKLGGELREELAKKKYENTRDAFRENLAVKYDHGFKFEWEESKQAINKMRVEDIMDDSFTKRFQKGVNLIEGRNRGQFADYVEKLVREVPNRPGENIQDYLYRVAGVRGSSSSK